MDMEVSGYYRHTFFLGPHKRNQNDSEYANLFHCAEASLTVCRRSRDGQDQVHQAEDIWTWPVVSSVDLSPGQLFHPIFFCVDPCLQDCPLVRDVGYTDTSRFEDRIKMLAVAVNFLVPKVWK